MEGRAICGGTFGPSIANLHINREELKPGAKGLLAEISLPVRLSEQEMANTGRRKKKNNTELLLNLCFKKKSAVVRKHLLSEPIEPPIKHSDCFEGCLFYESAASRLR